MTIRVEGVTDTLVPITSVSTTTGTFTKSPGGPGCNRDSAGGALEQATAGNWSGAFDSYGQKVETIAGEQHSFFSGAYWSIYVNARPADSGACTQKVQTGDAVTFYPQCEGAPAPTCFSGLLILGSAPATVAPGGSATITVDQVATTYDPPLYEAVTTRTPAVGASVTAGDVAAVVGADGRATVPVGTATGVRRIVATLGDRVRATGALCVTNGADGACGSPAAQLVLGAGPASSQPAVAGTPCATSGADGRCGTRDRQAPKATLAGITDKQVFAAGKGPRALSGTVGVAGVALRQAAALQPDPSGVLMVKLRISRRDGKKCSYFSGRQERFRPAKCGVANAKWFKIGDRADWSYLLPSRLPRGEYVIDVNAIDKAYNRDDARERGRNRVIFGVR